MSELRIYRDPRPERADAARNRVRILAAAEALFAARGVMGVSMDEVAAAAGVGKGTLYRRFGDKAGLGIAVLDDRERDLQDAVLRGPPPLGPGAPPVDRLHAFVDAYLDYLHRNLDLVVMSETASVGGRYRSGVYAGWHWHTQALLTEARRQHPALLADYLLAALAGDLHRHLLERGAPFTDVRSALHQVLEGMGADAVVGPD